MPLAFFHVFGPCELIGLLLSVLPTLFWLWMLIDCLQNETLQGTDKIVWILVVILLPCVGAVLYFFLAKQRAP